MMSIKKIASVATVTLLMASVTGQANSKVCINNEVTGECVPLEEFQRKNRIKQADEISTTNLHALIVGVTDYNLKISSELIKTDTAMMEETLNRQPYKRKNITVLNKVENTNKDNILKAFDNVRQKVGTEDIFVFYLSGNVIKNKDGIFILTSDTKSENDYQNSAINSNELVSKLKSIPTKKKFIIIDTSNAHLIFDTDAVIGKDVMIMNATSGNSMALANSKGSIFSLFVNSALAGSADINQDGLLTTSEIAKFVDLEARKETAGKLRPSYISFGDDIVVTSETD